MLPNSVRQKVVRLPSTAFEPGNPLAVDETVIGLPNARFTPVAGVGVAVRVCEGVAVAVGPPGVLVKVGVDVGPLGVLVGVGVAVGPPLIPDPLYAPRLGAALDETGLPQ